MSAQDASTSRSSIGKPTRGSSNRRIVPAIPRSLVPKRPTQPAPTQPEPVPDPQPVPETAELSEEKEQTLHVATGSDEASQVSVLDNTEEPLATVDGEVVKSVSKDIANEEPPLPPLAERQGAGDATPSNVNGSKTEKNKSPGRSLEHLSTKGNHFPPPFYPARDFHQSQSVNASSHNDSAPLPLPLRPHMHATQPSNDSIVFGSYADSSNSSPAHPGSAGSTFAPPPPPPGLSFANGPPVYPAYGHAAHPSYSAHPTFDARYDMYYPNQPYPSAPLPFVPGPNRGLDQSIPASAHKPSTNGHNHTSRSPSQASAGAAFDVRNGDSGVVTPDAGMQSMEAFGPTSQQFIPRQSFAQSSMTTPLHNLQEMRHFLLSRLGSYDFADYILELMREGSQEPLLIPAHGLLLGRSSGLRSLIKSAAKDDGSGYTRLSVPRAFYFKEPDAFVEALRYLYGGDLLEANRFLQRMPPTYTGIKEVQEDLEARMRYVLSYVASSRSMALPEPTFHGSYIASRLIRWETVKLVFDFLNTDSSPQGPSSNFANPNGQLLHDALQFITSNFPVDFELDTNARHTASTSATSETTADTRSPVFPAPSKDTSRHRRFESIRFGQVSTDQDTSLTIPSVLSNILLSVPFTILKSILEHNALYNRLGPAELARQARAVVAERERRRVEASKQRQGQISDTGGTDPAPTQDLQWKESVEVSEKSALEFVVSRYWVQDVETSLA